jgi:hypothetical protein
MRGTLKDELCHGGASRRTGILRYRRFRIGLFGREHGPFAYASRSRRARSHQFLRPLGGCGNQSSRPPDGCGGWGLCIADALGVLWYGLRGFGGGLRRLRRRGQVVRGPGVGGRKHGGFDRGVRLQATAAGEADRERCNENRVGKRCARRDRGRQGPCRQGQFPAPQLGAARRSQPRVNGDAFSPRRHDARVSESLRERGGAHIQHYDI